MYKGRYMESMGMNKRMRPKNLLTLTVALFCIVYGCCLINMEVSANYVRSTTEPVTAAPSDHDAPNISTAGNNTSESNNITDATENQSEASSTMTTVIISESTTTTPTPATPTESSKPASSPTELPAENGGNKGMEEPKSSGLHVAIILLIVAVCFAVIAGVLIYVRTHCKGRRRASSHNLDRDSGVQLFSMQQFSSYKSGDDSVKLIGNGDFNFEEEYFF